MTFITTAGWVAQAVKGAVLHGDADTGIARVCTDARKTEPGDLFVGLRGERFDGTDFAADAAARGASAVMVSRLIEGINAVQIVVPDVNQAFCESAAASSDLRGLASALFNSGDLGFRQQRQNHDDSDDRVDSPRGLWPRRISLHGRQLQ